MRKVGVIGRNSGPCIAAIAFFFSDKIKKKNALCQTYEQNIIAVLPLVDL